MNRLRTVFAIWALLFSSVFVPACKQQEPAPTQSPDPCDLGRAAFKPDLINVSYECTGNSGRRGVVYLIGENHAGVKAQGQVADILNGLYEKNAIDAILMEGSFGDIVPDRSLQADDSGRRSYWRAELEWGHIAGYEFMALTRQGATVIGVEDMAAKAAFGLALDRPNEESLQRMVEKDKRAAALFQQAIDKLSPSGEDARRLEGLRAAHERATARLHAAYGDLVQVAKPGEKRGAFEEERAVLADKARRLLLKLGPAMQLSDELNRKIQAFNTDLMAYRRAPDDKKVDTLKAHKAEIESLQARLKSFENDADELSRSEKRLQAINKEIDALEKPLRRAEEALVPASTAVEDAFFAVANALRDLGEPRGISFPAIESFLRDEAERAEKEAKSGGANMDRRDAAMVANTITFVDDGKRHTASKGVALVVGSMHLAGMSKRLQDEGFRVVGGKVTAADDEIAPWEEDAWARRGRGYIAFLPGAKMNSNTTFQSPGWNEWQHWALGQLPNLESNSTLIADDLAGHGKGYLTDIAGPGGIKKPRAVYIRDSAFVHGRGIGEPLDLAGPVPGKPGAHYEMYDRDAAMTFVGSLSDRETAFAYAYKTSKGGKPGYEILTPDGPRSLAAFEASPPGGRPRRVVLVKEPDEVQEGQTILSPLWKKLRERGERPKNGGNGGEPPRPPRWTTGWAEPEEQGPRKRTPIYLSENARRAKRNLEHIDKLDPRLLGAVAFLDHTGLESLHFTPETGEHAHTVVIVAKNTAEFRAELRRAAKAGKLQNKQVALITCGDAFQETAALREDLFEAGAVMVWTPDRQVTPEAGKNLAARIKTTVESMRPEDRPRSITDLVYQSLDAWERDAPTDPGWKSFELSAGWVLWTPLSADPVLTSRAG